MDASITSAEQDLISFYLSDAQRSLNEAVEGMGCGGEVIRPRTLSRYWQAQAMVWAFQDEQDPRILEAWAASKRGDPTYFNEDYGETYHKAWESAQSMEYQRSMLVLRELREGTKVWIDGRPLLYPTVSLGFHILQVGKVRPSFSRSLRIEGESVSVELPKALTQNKARVQVPKVVQRERPVGQTKSISPQQPPLVEELTEYAIVDLDGDTTTGRKTRKKKTLDTGDRARLTRANPRFLQLWIRGGYSSYYTFGFLTLGAELGVTLNKNVMLIGGFDTFSVQRGSGTWNTIYPGNIGLIYKIRAGTIAVPYLGADVIFVQYYADEQGEDWAVGARVRGGIDIVVHKNFYLNLNLAVGVWTGQNWTFIEPTVRSTGLLSQANIGFAVAL